MFRVELLRPPWSRADYVARAGEGEMQPAGLSGIHGQCLDEYGKYRNYRRVSAGIQTGERHNGLRRRYRQRDRARRPRLQLQSRGGIAVLAKEEGKVVTAR